MGTSGSCLLLPASPRNLGAVTPTATKMPSSDGLPAPSCSKPAEEAVVAPSAIEVGIVDSELPTLFGSRKPEGKPDKIVKPAPLDPETVDASPCAAEAEASRELRRVHYTKLVSYISLIASALVAGLGIGVGVHNETLSLVGLGLEAALDGLSSALVVWRFKTGKRHQHEDAEAAARYKAQRDAVRERNSGVGIGCTFVASAMYLLCTAAYKFLSWEPEAAGHEAESATGANWTVLLSLPSSLIFGTLAVLKFMLASKLRSQVLEKDALCSLLGALLAFVCSVAGLLEEAVEDPASMATVDAVASGVIAVVLLVEGVRTLHHNVPLKVQKDVPTPVAAAAPPPLAAVAAAAAQS